MIWDSSQFKGMEGVRSAVLTERCDASPSEFSIEVDVGSEVGMEFSEPEALMHQGGVLFYGKGTSGSGSNRGGDAVLTSTASDFRWMFDRQTLGEQIGELHLRSRLQRDLTGAANRALASWEGLAESSRMEAAGWSCDAGGVPVKGTTLGLDVSRAGEYTTGSHTNKGTVLSIGFALRRLKRANPGTYLLPNYQTGELRVLRYEELPHLGLDTRIHHILEISGITPNYENVPTGVAVVVEWPEREGAMGREVLYSKLYTYPEDLDMEATGVRVFRTTAPNEAAADRQAEHVMRQLRAWFEGACHVMCSGSVTLKMQDLAGSPLGHRLSIAGPGSIDTMSTPITSVEWDFLRETVTLQLGGDIPEPRISTLPFPEYEPVSRSTTGGSGSWPSTTREESSTTETTTGGDTTYTEPGSVSSTTFGPVSTTEGPEPTWSSTTVSTTGSSSTGGTGTDSTTCGCGCAERWRELERRLVVINERLEILERGGGGSCECQCLAGGLMEQIQAAIDEAVGNVQVRASLTQLLEVTQTGNLMIDGEVNANSTGGTSSVDAHY